MANIRLDKTGRTVAMAKRKTAAKKKVAEPASDNFDDVVTELEEICDVSFNKRHSLFVDKRPFEARLCSVDSSNILAYFYRDHATRDCEYLSQSSLMPELISTAVCPKVQAFIERYG